jgi:ACS family sodium-dependent inorganic phosphate cotransporter
MGAKRMYAMALFISSLATIALSIIYYIENISFPLIVALRILIGAAQGAIYPATYTLWSKWAVPDERGTLLSISFSGSNIGTCKKRLYFNKTFFIL